MIITGIIYRKGTDSMDLKQVEYIIKIAEENNISHAAEKLFITQSALNQQLLKLEKELGVPLFHRSRTNWRLTEAGEIYVRNARELLRIKKNTYDQIRDIGNAKKGTLSIGLTPGRGIAMFGAVYPDFHREYPEITVEPMEKRVHELQAMISDDQLDIAFLTLNAEDRTKDNYITLAQEEILLAIPEKHPLSACAAPPGEAYAIMELDRLRTEPFVLMDKTSSMRTLASRIFEASGFHPNVLFETQDNHTITTMIRANICCGLIPAYYANLNPEGIRCFSLPSHPTWQVCVSYRQNRYLSNAAKCFIRLARKHWNF